MPDARIPVTSAEHLAFSALAFRLLLDLSRPAPCCLGPCENSGTLRMPRQYAVQRSVCADAAATERRFDTVDDKTAPCSRRRCSTGRSLSNGL